MLYTSNIISKLVLFILSYTPNTWELIFLFYYLNRTLYHKLPYIYIFYCITWKLYQSLSYIIKIILITPSSVTKMYLYVYMPLHVSVNNNHHQKANQHLKETTITMLFCLLKMVIYWPKHVKAYVDTNIF
jgi:hypothetical protein